MVAIRVIGVIFCEAKFSVLKYKVAVVPAGMLVPRMFTVSGELELRVTSGTVKLPVRLGGTVTPPMLVTIIEG